MASKFKMNKRGFTLFEILMALAILGVVFSILYLTFHQSMTVMAYTEERAEVIRQGRMILERMTGELKGAILPAPGSPQGLPFRYGLVGRTGKERGYFRDRLDFTACTLLQINSGQAERNIVEIGYFLDYEPGGKALTLFRRQDDLVDRDLLQGGRSMAICDRVRALHFIFWGRQKEAEKEWNSLEGAQRNQLPARVQIELVLEDARGQVHTFRTQVSLPAAGEAG